MSLTCIFSASSVTHTEVGLEAAASTTVPHVHPHKKCAIYDPYEGKLMHMLWLANLSPSSILPEHIFVKLMFECNLPIRY